MSEVKENGVWQTLMDEAYAKWHEEKQWSYTDFIRHLSPVERAAVLLGNLNHQVENGGFCQWVDNGYAQHGGELLDVLDDIDTQTSRELAEKIDNLLEHVDLKKRSRGWDDYRERDKCEHCGREDEEPEGISEARLMDDWYYTKIQPKLLPEIETYLTTLQAKENSHD